MSAATQTLLTVDDVADELGCSTVMVQRLIALGVLKATQLVEGSIRSFRISRPALEAYVTAGSPRFELNPGASHFKQDGPYGWFRDTHITYLRRAFEGIVYDRLEKLLPEPDEKLPDGVAADPKGDKFRKVVIEVEQKYVEDLLTMAVPYGSTVAMPKTFPGRTDFEGRWADAWLVDRFWDRLQAVVSEEGDPASIPGVERLYQLPATFNAFVDAAWERVGTGAFVRTKQYHLTFTEVRYSDPKVNLVSAAEAVQTVEIELVLKFDRIAQGAMSRVLQSSL
ncbi:MAG: helix-turn-helix domain-containing protein [Planctomycetaceae bacterium]|nr:helix-turn-helix domain-containing protein [Planctomycetaceae bacterium]